MMTNMYGSNQNINDNIMYSHEGQLWAAESEKNLEKEIVGSDLFHVLASVLINRVYIS